MTFVRKSREVHVIIRSLLLVENLAFVPMRINIDSVIEAAYPAVT
jgi:hypothetical protein